MNNTYIYTAEYVSKQDNLHYIWVDLGFRTWKTMGIPLNTGDSYKPGTKLLIRMELTKKRPHEYKGHILEIDGEPVK